MKILVRERGFTVACIGLLLGLANGSVQARERWPYWPQRKQLLAATEFGHCAATWPRPSHDVQNGPPCTFPPQGPRTTSGTPTPQR